MMQKERLVELLDGLELPPIDTDGEMYLEKSDAEYIADYLLNNGVIAPPCKVGDMVYSIVLDCNHYTRGCNGDCPACTHRLYRIAKGKITTNLQAVNVGEKLGTSSFLTREAAEQALKERDQK